MKTSDITDEQFLDAVREALRIRPSSIGVSRWDVQAVLAGMPEFVEFYARRAAEWRQPPFGPQPQGPPQAWWDEIGQRVPEKIVLSKMKKLVRRGLLDGCACGCRGDMEPVSSSGG